MIGSSRRALFDSVMVLFGLAFALLPLPVSGGNPPEEWRDEQCVSCHADRDPALVSAWRAGPHGPPGGASCASCHGPGHAFALAQARKADACTSCHGGGQAKVIHSYATSKHGVIVSTSAETDWSLPLRDGNYRAPTCAYCHMHASQHDVSALVTPWSPWSEAATSEHAVHPMQRVCQECHSPRYLQRLFDNGRRMEEIGRMKLREARELVDLARRQFPEADLAEAERLLHRMEREQLKSVRLGVGHQSPDYQWWHGHPALDGSLLRIKGQIDAIRLTNSKKP